MKTYKVQGYAMIPVEVEVTVEAETRDAAINAAVNKFDKDRSAYIVPNSCDESAVCQWEPFAEEHNPHGLQKE